MKLSIFHLLFHTSAMYWFSKHISPETLFSMCRRTVGLSLRFNPHTHRYLRPLRSVLEAQLESERLRDIAHKHLVYRRYVDNLPIVWREQLRRGRNFFKIDGEEHIKAALAAGKGAILLSSHNFGAHRPIPPAISKLGYPISRVGGWDEGAMVHLWGNEEERAWKKIHLGSDHWSRLRVSKQIAAALRENSLIFMSMPNRLTGPPEGKVCVFGQNFYIDAAMLRLFDHLHAVVLPCFALCDDRGQIHIIVHRPLIGAIDEMSRAYCKLFSAYLTEYPEFCRFWKRLVQKKAQW
jgi:lauroyl/myristoyl acyltransferase